MSSHDSPDMTEEQFVEALYRQNNSTERPIRVLEWALTLDPNNPADAASFWRVVVNEWPNFDAIPHDNFAEVFETFRDTAPGASELPKRFTVYRGQDYFDELGLSWTLDYSVAETFAQGHRGISHEEPNVFKLKVTRDQVAFFTNDREEAEVVLRELPDYFDCEYLD